MVGGRFSARSDGGTRASPAISRRTCGPRFSCLPPKATSIPFFWKLANDGFHIVSLSIAGAGLITWTRRNWHSAACLFAVFYVAALGSTWAQTDRYLIPLYPLLLFGLFAGLRAAIGRIRSGWSSVALSSATLGIAGIIALLGTIEILRQPRPVDLSRDSDTLELVSYVRQIGVLETEVRVLAPRPRTLAWETGIPTAEPFSEAGLDETLVELERLRITHVVLAAPHTGVGEREAVTRLLEEFPCRFDLAFGNGSYTVYRLAPECPS